MKLSTIIKRIPLWYMAAIDESKPDRIRCRYIKSAPGRGKTSVMAGASVQLSKLLNKRIGHVIINGPLLTPADSVGYLVPKHMSDGHTESVYTDPFWFRTAEGDRLDQYDGGIVIIDEADKMDSDVKKVIGEAALSGRLGPHILPKGWVVWMAGNRSEDRSGSTKELDHLINRRGEHDVTDDIESWNDWALANGVSVMTMAFANQNIEIVFAPTRPEKQGPWCTPRSLVMADSYLQTIAESEGAIPDDPDTVEEIGGIIGAGAAAQLFAFVRLERQMPKFETIIAKPKEVKVPDKPDAQMLIVYNLAHRVTPETAGPVITYLERFSKEFAVTFAKAAVRRNHKLVSTPAFQKWSQNNASLMAAIAAAS